MKINDVYICIKDLISKDDNILIYKSGKSYFVDEISIQCNNECVIFHPAEYNAFGYTGSCLLIDKSANNIINGFEWCILDDYFITLKEYRKQKLKKLYENL